MKVDIAAYQTLGPDSQEPRCRLGDATDLLNKFKELATVVPALAPIDVYAAPPPGNPALGMVTVKELLANGAQNDDLSYDLIIHLKRDQIPVDQRASGDPIFTASKHQWNVASLYLLLAGGKPEQLRDFFMNLSGQPGQGGGGDPTAGLLEYQQFMNQGPIRSATITAMTSGLRPLPAEFRGPDFSLPNPLLKGGGKNLDDE